MPCVRAMSLKMRVREGRLGQSPGYGHSVIVVGAGVAMEDGLLGLSVPLCA